MRTALWVEPGPQLQPAGVRVLGWASEGLAVYLTANGVLVRFGTVSIASGAYLLGGLETMGPTVYFLVALGLAGLGLGLLKAWRWSRRVGILAAGLVIAGAMMPISAAVIDARIWDMAIHGAKVVLASVIIRYLMQPAVTDYFSARIGSKAT